MTSSGVKQGAGARERGWEGEERISLCIIWFRRVSGSTKRLPAVNQKSLLLQLHVTGRNQIISLSLKQPTWTVPVPVLKNSVVHFLPPGASSFSRERENSSQLSENLLTGLIKQRGQQQAWVAASSPLQEYRTWIFSPLNASLLPLHSPTACL